MISPMEAPAATNSRINSTLIRVPLMIGLPPNISGFLVMQVNGIMVYLFDYKYSRFYVAVSYEVA